MNSIPSNVANRFVRLVLVASLAGAAVNLGASAVTPSDSQALVRHDGGSLAEVLAGEQPFVANRYELFGWLRSYAGAMIVVPGDLLDDYTLEHLSRLEPVRAGNRPRAPERLIGEFADLTRFRGFAETQPGSDDVRVYVVATRSDDPELLEVYLTRRSGTILVVDRVLADEAGLP